jgi:hypothetical protein
MCAIGAVAFLFENGYLTVNALRPPQALVDRMRAVRQLNPWLRRAYDVFVPFIQSLFLIDPLAGNANNNANENNAAVEDEQQENNNVDNGVNNNDDDNNNNNNNPPDDEGLRRRNNNGHQNNAEFLMGQ